MNDCRVESPFTKCFSVNYYFDNNDFQLNGSLTIWPMVLSVAAWGVYGLIIGKNFWIFTGLLGFSIVLMFVCVMITRFYSNSSLMVNTLGLILQRQKNVIEFKWEDIGLIKFLEPKGFTYKEVVIAIYLKDSAIKYIIVDTLYFKSAKTVAGQIKSQVKDQFDNVEFITTDTLFDRDLYLSPKRIEKKY